MTRHSKASTDIAGVREQIEANFRVLALPQLAHRHEIVISAPDDYSYCAAVIGSATSAEKAKLVVKSDQVQSPERALRVLLDWTAAMLHERGKTALYTIAEHPKDQTGACTPMEKPTAQQTPEQAEEAQKVKERMQAQQANKAAAELQALHSYWGDDEEFPPIPPSLQAAMKKEQEDAAFFLRAWTEAKIKKSNKQELQYEEERQARIEARSLASAQQEEAPPFQTSTEPRYGPCPAEAPECTGCKRLSLWDTPRRGRHFRIPEQNGRIRVQTSADGECYGIGLDCDFEWHAG